MGIRFWLSTFLLIKKINKPYIGILSLIILLIIIFTNLSENIIIKNLLSVFAAGLFIISYRKNIYIENEFFNISVNFIFFLFMAFANYIFTNIYISNEIFNFIKLYMTYFFEYNILFC